MPGEDAYNSANVIAASARDGWLLGYIGIPWPGPWPKRCGDLFVVDPSGWQAGLAWETSGPPIKELVGPSKDRWGVYQVRFTVPVISEGSLIENFHLVLPLLKKQRANIPAREAR